jgi:hypothetical protein
MQNGLLTAVAFLKRNRQSSPSVLHTAGMRKLKSNETVVRKAQISTVLLLGSTALNMREISFAVVCRSTMGACSMPLQAALPIRWECPDSASLRTIIYFAEWEIRSAD